jgi:tryptophan 2,3-dioxygenase
MKKVDRVKRRFVEHGFEVALEKRKADRQHMKKADGDFEAHLLALSCSQPPYGHARWSLRMLAGKMVELEYVESLSHETVRRVLKKTN